MRSTLISVAGLTLMMAALVVPMYAGSYGPDSPRVELSFDEDGHANALYGGVYHNVPASIMLDPSSGMMFLAYQLPFLDGFGCCFDVGINDQSGQLSDGLRFEDINGKSYMFYFSDPNVPFGYSQAKADKYGFPSNFFPSRRYTEFGTEGNFTQFDFNVVGYGGGNAGNRYTGQSDLFVPEIDPSSSMGALALLSGALLVIRGSRKKVKSI